MESDIYRTKDGKAHFSFNFRRAGDFFEIDVIYSPREIDKQLIQDSCNKSPEGDLIIALSQKPRDINTARFMAGDWAESLWEKRTVS